MGMGAPCRAVQGRTRKRGAACFGWLPSVTRCLPRVPPPPAQGGPPGSCCGRAPHWSNQPSADAGCWASCPPPSTAGPAGTSRSSNGAASLQTRLRPRSACARGATAPACTCRGARLTLNICFTLCRGRFTFSLCNSCRTSPMLRLPSPFLSASSNVCFSHFRAELGTNTAPAGPATPTPTARAGRRGGPQPKHAFPLLLPQVGDPARGRRTPAGWVARP